MHRYAIFQMWGPFREQLIAGSPGPSDLPERLPTRNPRGRGGTGSAREDHRPAEP